MLHKFLAWLWGGSTPIGSLVPGWNAYRAEQAAADTERLLLGACSSPRIELSAAQRARRRGVA